MNPLLQNFDKLYVSPYSDKHPRIGDVIVFTSPEGGENIVHRIIFAGPDKVLTRGDNNDFIDDGGLSYEHIIGQVLYARRGKRCFRVYGGTIGHLSGTILHIILIAKHMASRMLYRPYCLFCRSKAIRKLLFGKGEMHVISVNSPKGTEIKLMLGNRLVGRRDSSSECWHIFKQYRPFIDEASLPGAIHCDKASSQLSDVNARDDHRS